MVLRVTMDFFQHRYYRLNKTLMTLIGQWPGQSARVRGGIVAVFIFLGTSSIVPQILALVKHRDDWRTVLDCVLPLVLEAISATNLIGFMWNSQKTLRMLKRIRTDWQVWAQDREVNILHRYTEQGKNLSILHTATIYTTTFIFMTQPIIPKIIDVFFTNVTKPGKFPFPVDYYCLDVQKYYWYIIMNSHVCMCLILTLLVASDVMLITYVHHVCGIFTALGHKLERVRTNDMSVKIRESPYTLEKRDMVHLASCIDRHNDAIEYANLIEATYTWTFCFIIGLGIILFNVIGLQILLRTSDPEATIRFVAVAMSLELVFYLDCWISQFLMDHSISIGIHIQNSQWYRLSLKAQKLLQFMTMRCGVPCHLTAGKKFIISMRTYGLTFRTAMSYFTLVRSMRGL